jgi:iron complex outermembrane receptor protein
VAAYTLDDQIYTTYTEQLSVCQVSPPFSLPCSGARPVTERFDRAGNAIPGVPAHQLLARIGYDQPTGPLAGLGAYVEAVVQDGFFIDNANQLKAPGYTVVNANVHYAADLPGGYAKRISLYAEVRNVFDETYVSSAQNLANSLSSTTGLQNGAGVLATTPGSVFAGAPRNVVAGMRLSF